MAVVGDGGPGRTGGWVAAGGGAVDGRSDGQLAVFASLGPPRPSSQAPQCGTATIPMATSYHREDDTRKAGEGATSVLTHKTTFSYGCALHNSRHPFMCPLDASTGGGGITRSGTKPSFQTALTEGCFRRNRTSRASYRNPLSADHARRQACPWSGCLALDCRISSRLLRRPSTCLI